MPLRFLIIVLLILAAVFYFQNGSLKTENVATFEPIKKSVVGLAEESKIEEVEKAIKAVSAPPPLRIKKEVSQEVPPSILTRLGIFTWTNTQRIINGFPALQESAELNAVALFKADDILKRQYFNHISPIGEGPAELAKKAGYEYISIGENLAMGNFKNDGDLVESWMNSPGHRANILNFKYKELGVAVVKGEYKGETVWVAVQEFGLPLSACSQPEQALKNQIEQAQNQINNFKSQIEDKIQELESKKFNGRQEYNQKINEYNELVNQHNNLIETIKSLISDYNNQVNNFNFCLKA
ncbi:MAG: CAP domain-containing protein [bacterium]|nr:CAP domain-containing protein [bacterium]